MKTSTKPWQAWLHLLQASYREGRLLELGSGAGKFSVELARMGYDVMGVEISPSALEWAQEGAADAGILARFQVDDVVNSASLYERVV